MTSLSAKALHWNGDGSMERYPNSCAVRATYAAKRKANETRYVSIPILAKGKC